MEKVINEQNYREMVDIIRNIEDVKDVYLMESEEGIYIYVERFPIMRSIRVEGNVALIRDEILSYLGFYEGMPVRGPEFNELDVEERVKRLYMDRGFLDASVRVTLIRDEDGYIDLYMGIDEGPVYFTDGGVYRGSSYPYSILDEAIGLVRGRVIKESFFRESVFQLQDFYIEEGFWDSFVYYEGLEKLRLNRPFYRVLMPMDGRIKRSPFRLLGSLSEGISNLFSHPIATFRAITGRGFVARPVFQIIEGRRYKINQEGANFFTEKELTAISGLQSKGVDPFSLEEARENIIRAYHKKGFFDVKVEYERIGEVINFKIHEGYRYKILGEGFEEEFYDEDMLESLLKSKLEKLYKEGYTLVDGRLKKEVLRDKKEVKVEFDINPGKRQILKDVKYEGENKDIKKLFSKHKDKLPAIFNTNLIEDLNIDLQNYFLKKGLMDGNFDIDVKVQEDEENILYTYIYRVEEGQVYKLGDTIYYGYEKTSSRELSYMTKKAQNYSQNLDDETLHNMLTSGIFNGVSIDTFVDKEEKVVHRLIQLSEDKRGILDLSIGYNTEENISLEGFIGLKNLFGVGLSSGLKYRKTGKRELYELSLSDNFLFSSKYWFKSNLFKTYEEHKSYSLDSYGSNLQLGYRITRNTSVGPVFSLLRNEVDGQKYNIRKYGVFLLREFKDDIFSPSRIHYDSVNFSLAEGDARYSKFDLSTFYLIPLPKDFKLSFKVAGGAVWGDAPIFDRFFLGGLRDLRGYSYEEIGQPNGGKYYTFGRLEFIFSLRESFVGAFFGDAGSVANKPKDLFKDVKANAGVALGVNTPIGPIRIDVAFPFENNWLSRFKVYLSVGYYY
ncbi:BamA/TamA family outer membrane protein [Hydrogenobacter sp. T-2]|uniref:BamA/TamA family outer membrane protein n=1 Tax=Pampinifervens diazotrophicum TaxID=1632018 RepID=UPI002B261C05|nr:BamA/TamA family outer membrane protein [Hydrogenobacter sp. T-2]WPM32175.1 BamA/TamA family outer membrane protein [Hydrogenobacter sp. T-2]